MSDEQRIIEFLDSKPGYRRTGAKKIANIIGVSDIKLIKQVKNNYKEGIIYHKVNPVQTDITPELIEKIKIALTKTDITPIFNESPAKMFSPKAAVDKTVFKTEGIHLLMGCSHVPFHNVELHEGIRNLISDLGSKMVGFHLMGDFLDINSLSSHDRGKFTAVPGLTLEGEYHDGNRELQLFEKVLPSSVVDKSYLYGNHEDRVFRYNSDMQNAKNPALLPHDAMSLREKGYSVKERWSQDFITVGDLDVFHGIYFNIHNAKKHLDTFNRSCAYVHTHRSQMYREGDNAAYNIGACANLKSPAFNYASRAMKNAWANGFALVHVDDKGQHYVSQIDVKNSKFFYNGIQY